MSETVLVEVTSDKPVDRVMKGGTLMMDAETANFFQSNGLVKVVPPITELGAEPEKPQGKAIGRAAEVERNNRAASNPD